MCGNEQPHPRVSAAPPREPPWTLGPILFPIILCTRARVVCGLHKWDPSLILPAVARDSSRVSPQACLKGSAMFLVNRCSVDIELLMSAAQACARCCRGLQSGSLWVCALPRVFLQDGFQEVGLPRKEGAYVQCHGHFCGPSPGLCVFT